MLTDFEFYKMNPSFNLLWEYSGRLGDETSRQEDRSDGRTVNSSFVSFSLLQDVINIEFVSKPIWPYYSFLVINEEVGKMISILPSFSQSVS